MSYHSSTSSRPSDDWDPQGYKEETPEDELLNLMVEEEVDGKAKKDDDEEELEPVEKILEAAEGESTATAEEEEEERKKKNKKLPPALAELDELAAQLERESRVFNTGDEE